MSTEELVSYWARSARYLAFRHVLRKSHLVARSSLFDLRFRFRTEDVVGRRVYKRGIHEAALTRYLLDHVPFRPGDVVFDVGAHFGWYALLMDRALPDGAQVYAVEPDPENFGLLRDNLRLNGARRVVALQCALSHEEGTTWLHRYPAKNLGRHSVLPLHDGERIEVRATTLDLLRSREGLEDRLPRLVKLDVEGYEQHVLRGALETLRLTPFVVMEHAPELLVRAGLSPDAALTLMDSFGFRPHLLERGGPVPVDPEALAHRNGTTEVLWKRDGTDASGARRWSSVPGVSFERGARTGGTPSWEAPDARAPRLSVIVITRNEEERLARTLESVGWADEIVVVDSGSTDGTEKVARRYTDRFFVREWEGFGRQKAWALAMASGDWVLSLDADEVVSPQLRASIERALKNPGDTAGFEVNLDTWMLGRWLGRRGWYAEWKLRLFRGDRARFVNSLVHERAEVEGPVRRLAGPLLHYHDRGLAYELERINRYSTLAARQLHERGKRARGVAPALLRAVTYFLQHYLVKGGILYGRAGLVGALLRGCYGFLKYAKLWEFGHRPPEGPGESGARDDGGAPGTG